MSIPITLVTIHGRLDLPEFSSANWVTTFVVIDTSLAALLAIFIGLYIRNRKRVILPDIETVPAFSDILLRVRGLLSEGTVKDTILTEFPNILNAVAKVDGSDLDVSSTCYEIIHHKLGTIPDEAREALMALYDLYERLRFGNESPTSEDGQRFVSALVKLDETMGEQEAISK